MSDGTLISIFTTDAALLVQSWDDWLTEITGLSEPEVRGISLTKLIPELESNGILPYFERVLKNGDIETIPHAVQPYLFKCQPAGFSPHFESMQQRIAIAPLRENDAIVGLVVTIEDVTDRLNLTRDIALKLASTDETVRLRATEALSTAQVLEPEAMLVKMLGDSSWRVRRAAVDALAKHTGSSLAMSLLRSLREQHRNPSVLNGVLQVLSHSKVDIIPALIDCLNSEDKDLRIYAGLALGEQQDSRCIPALIRSLEDEDINVRYHAIDALGKMRASGAIEKLLAIAESGDFFLAFPALDALTRIGDPTIAQRLIPLLEDELLCTAGADALGQLGDSSVVPSLAVLLNRTDAPVMVAAGALATLYDRYESTYGEGNYIIELATESIDDRGMENLVNGVATAGSDELKAIVLLLGKMEGTLVERTLTQLLGQQTVRSSVVESLVRHGRQVTELLIEQLNSDDIEIRRAAAIALGRIGDPRSVSALTRLLTADPELMVIVAGALAQIGDRRAFDTLLDLIGHPDAAVRLAVVAALNSLGHPDMLIRTIDLLQDQNPHIRESAVKIAGYFAFNECVTLLLDRCRDPDENVRRAAIELIPYLENAPVLPTLIAALEKETPKVRAAAARALGQMESVLAYPYLLSALKDEDAWVRYYATRAIGWNGYPEAIEVLAKAAVSDPAHQVQIATVEALGRIGGPRAVTILAPIVENINASSDLVRVTLTALGEIGHPNSLPPLLSATRSLDPYRRIHAARALGKRGGTGVESALQELANKDPEVGVVFSAIEALAQLATPDAIAALLELTANPTRNEACIVALANLGEEQIEAIGRGLTHSHAKVKRAVVEVLMRLKHPRASELLIAALDDRDTSVRLAAVNALNHLGNRYAERKMAILAHTDPDPAVRRAAQKGAKTIADFGF
ncbi:MAG TPA: HEAT repeat domain-containing protein [Leptolyngbyaceae cyanobacterium]